jgi:hypothetical protein
VDQVRSGWQESRPVYGRMLWQHVHLITKGTVGVYGYPELMPVPKFQSCRVTGADIYIYIFSDQIEQTVL